jgi:chorismate synthase
MFRFLTTGESHGQCLTAIIEGLPAGLKVNVDKINEELAKRQQGYGRGGRMKIETDRVDIVSGVRFGETMGDPITLRIQNKDWENWTDRMSVSGMPAGAPVTAARPGHADLSGILKYDRTDIRDILERASARETAARVAVGALCKQFLESCGISLVAHVTNIGGVAMTDADIQDWDHYSASEMRCTNEAVEARSTTDIVCSGINKSYARGYVQLKGITLLNTNDRALGLYSSFICKFNESLGFARALTANQQLNHFKILLNRVRDPL